MVGGWLETASGRTRGALVLCGLLIAQLLQMVASQELQVGFYDESCPLAETIVRAAVEQGVQQDRGNAPGLIRLHFHDCFVQV